MERAIEQQVTGLAITLSTGRTENLAVVITDWAALPLMLTADEAAQAARVGIFLIREGIRTKRVPHVYFGRIPRIPRDAFRAWVEGRELEPLAAGQAAEAVREAA